MIFARCSNGKLLLPSIFYRLVRRSIRLYVTVYHLPEIGSSVSRVASLTTRGAIFGTSSCQTAYINTATVSNLENTLHRSWVGITDHIYHHLPERSNRKMMITGGNCFSQLTVAHECFSFGFIMIGGQQTRSPWWHSFGSPSESVQCVGIGSHWVSVDHWVFVPLWKRNESQKCTHNGVVVANKRCSCAIQKLNVHLCCLLLPFLLYFTSFSK